MILQRRPRSLDAAYRGALPYMAEGAMLADVAAPTGTIGIVLGSVDR